MPTQAPASSTQQTIAVPIARVNPNGHIPLPDYQSADAAGMDIHASLAQGQTMTIEPGQVALVPAGFAMAVPVGYEAQIRPRSGLAAKHGISIPNAPGTIDADYRGEVKVLLINHSREPFVIEPAMRIAQMIIKPVPRTVWQEVDELPNTDRGTGGFGHTGH
jgi:dUTP pyrophosphatase